MANTQKYLNHLLQNTGITPACSEEEKQAADIIADIYRNHGFEPEVQEFNSKGTAKVVQAVLGILVFVGTLVAGFGGLATGVGMIVIIAAAVVYLLERSGKTVFSQLGAGGLSQNVIAYHQASGPLASPRNRPVVVVAHYDSPRVDFLCQEPFSTYRPTLVKLTPYLMVAPAVILVVRLLPVPTAFKTVLWIVAVVAACIPLANSIAIIANRFVLPYTSGSVCNKSSVAALLGVMDEVAPYRGRDEFPDDMPFDDYFAELQRSAEEAALMAESERQAKQEENKARQDELKGKIGGFFKRSGSGEENGGETAEEASADADGTDTYADEDFDDGFGGFEFSDVSDTAMAQPLEDEAVESPVRDDAFVEDADLEEVPSEEGESDQLEPGSTVQMAELEETEEDAFVPVVEEEPGAELEPLEDEPLEEAVLEEELDGDKGDADEEELEPRSFEAPAVAYPYVNDDGNRRYGPDVVRSLGMLPATCAISYPDDEQAAEEAARAKEAYEREQAARKRIEERREQAERARMERAAKRESIRKAVTEEYEERLQAEEAARAQAELEQELLEQADDESQEGELAEELPSDEVEGSEETAGSVADEAAEEPEPTEDEAPAEKGANTTQFFVVGSDAGVEKTAPYTGEQEEETVDALMAEISAANPASRRVAQRSINLPTTDVYTRSSENRAGSRLSLFDVPDPSADTPDPFAAPADEVALDDDGLEELPAAETAADAAQEDASTKPEKKKKRWSLSNLFGKKKQEESMTDWLGVDEDYDAKESGEEIGSWDNFENDDSWKGGATGPEDATEEELREAITSMGDDELLGHDIWFVATGSSENGNAGINAFLNTHRDKLRGVFLINLECVGAGQVMMLATEGGTRVLKGDKRIMKLVSKVSADFHNEYGSVEMPYVATDAYAAMSRSLRSLTLAGVDGNGFAFSHTEEDQPYNVDPDNIAMVTEVVTEVIRRS